MRTTATIPTVLIALLLTASLVEATTAGVKGVVEDASGAAVEGAMVELVHQSFGTSTTLTTNSKGKFVQMGLKPGTYDIRVTKDGYHEFAQSVHLALKKRTPVEIVLDKVGATGDEVGIDSFSLGGRKIAKEAGESFEAAQKALRAGDRAAAKVHVEALLALEPDIASAHRVLAQIHRDDGDADAAEASLRRALELEPEVADGWVALGELHADSGKLDGAISSYQKAIEMSPEHALAHKKLAMAFVMKQDLAAAVTPLERYLELAPDARDAGAKRALLEECRKIAGQ